MLDEFIRSKEIHGGADLKVVSWGTKGVETSKYTKVVAGDIVQTFRNFLSSIVERQVKKRMNRDGLLILIDEIDVIEDKHGLGSLIKSLSSPEVKFAVCGIGTDLTSLVQDHASIERLLEKGAINVSPMSLAESEHILTTAEKLFNYDIQFSSEVKTNIAELSLGYPYFTQLIGKACVNKANQLQTKIVSEQILKHVLNDIRNGSAFPTLESTYQRAIDQSEERQILLHLLAEQENSINKKHEIVGRVFLKNAKLDAEELGIANIEESMKRLTSSKLGSILVPVGESEGIYRFTNPIFRLYVCLRNF